ncbi:MAG: hypothetical protein K2G75_01430 [Muribaculaceae bacterium]|nr:hypothetical protein [Muribaculaceae bacterium]
MNYKPILSIVLAGMMFSAAAQTHKEGVEYYEAGQLSNAKELLERNLNNAGTDKAVTYYYQGLIALDDENPAEATRLFNLGVTANPEYAYNYIGLGQIELQKGSPKVAQENFKKAESLGKKDAAVQVAIARAYDSVDPALYADEIEKRIAKARKIDLNCPEIYIFEGDVKARNKDYGGAGASYEMAVNYDPKATAAYFKYANLFSQVNPEYGINMLKKLLADNPNSALGQRSLANAYYDQNMFKEAAEQYGKYVKNPNHFKQDEDRYAFLLFYGQDYQGGYDYATQLLNSNPDNFTAQRYQFMNAAQLPSKSGDLLSMADALYAKHLQNPDKNVMAPIDYTLIAEEFTTAKQPDKAVEVLNDGIKTLPNTASFYKQLAMVYVDKDDMPQASKAFDGFVKNTAEPGYNDMIQGAVFAFYAGVQAKATDAAASDAFYQQAADYADKAAELYPSMYRPEKIKGDIALQKGDKEATLAHYLKSIELLEAMDDTSRYASDAKNLYNYVGNAYLDKNDKATAKRYFNGYLKYDPDNADYRKFVDGL